MKTVKSKVNIRLEKWEREELERHCWVGVLVVEMGGVWGFKALPLLGAELWPQAMLSAKESSRGVEKRRGVVSKKDFTV